MWLAPEPADAKRALIVDDNNELRMLLSEIIASYGFSVAQAPNGKVALQLLECTCSAFELLLTDLCMPEMDGRDLIHEVRRRNPELPIIAITGMAGQEISQEVEALGVMLFRKPINFTALHACIETLMNR